MQQFKALRIISLILGFALVACGCATSKNQVADTDFGLTAEAVPEGVLLTFSNIPSDATHLWISLHSWSGTEEPESPYSIIQSFAGITDASVRGWVNSSRQLEKVKQTGKVIFPIVQAGQKYLISATVHNEREFRQMRDANFQPRRAETECVAKNGINFNRDLVNLALNDTNSVVTLSSEPVFSSEITFNAQKYSFGVTIHVPGTGSIGVGDHHNPDGLSSDGLTWVFEPQMTQNIKGDSTTTDWLESGINYSAWAASYVNIIYDDIRWSVEIAKTPEFTYSL
jgi:hypothetical protein